MKLYFDEEIIYSLNVLDIQRVAHQILERSLSSTEIEKIKYSIAERINWFDAIEYSITEKILNTEPETMA